MKNEIIKQVMNETTTANDDHVAGEHLPADGVPKPTSDASGRTSVSSWAKVSWVGGVPSHG